MDDPSENREIIKRRGPDDRTWYVVAEPMGMTEAEIIGGLLRTAGIPVYLFREALGTAMPLSVGLVGGVQVAVPESFYGEAMALLEGEPDALAGGTDADREEVEDDTEPPDEE